VYRVEACLPNCQRYEVNDAHAYLLERLGDIAAAIKLYVRDIERCNSALIQGVLQGDVLLPNVTSASGRYAVHTSPAPLQDCAPSQNAANTIHACCTGAFIIYVRLVRPVCTSLSFEVLDEMQQAVVKECIQPHCTKPPVYPLNPYRVNSHLWCAG